MKYLWRSCVARNGHGIHSPFAFDLIGNTIEEYNHYYFYDELKKRLSLFPLDQRLHEREARLLYRLALRFKPDHATIVANHSEMTEYLIRGAVPSVSIESPKPTIVPSPQMRPIDLLYIDYNNASSRLTPIYDWFKHRIPTHGITILRGIHRSTQARADWQQLRRAEARMSMDLLDFGLMFYAPSITEGHHTVHYSR